MNATASNFLGNGNRQFLTRDNGVSEICISLQQRSIYLLKTVNITSFIRLPSRGYDYKTMISPCSNGSGAWSFFRYMMEQMPAVSCFRNNLTFPEAPGPDPSLRHLERAFILSWTHQSREDSDSWVSRQQYTPLTVRSLCHVLQII